MRENQLGGLVLGAVALLAIFLVVGAFVGFVVLQQRRAVQMEVVAIQQAELARQQALLREFDVSRIEAMNQRKRADQLQAELDRVKAELAAEHSKPK